MTDESVDKETGLDLSARHDHEDEEKRNAHLAEAARKAANSTTEDLAVDDPESPSTLPQNDPD
jgi:hypothetical protein